MTSDQLAGELKNFKKIAERLHSLARYQVSRAVVMVSRFAESVSDYSTSAGPSKHKRASKS